MRILAVARKEKYSPNHIGNDAAIFNAVCTELVMSGAKVEVCDEESFLDQQTVDQDFIITMARTKSLIRRLKSLEQEGKVVLNSAFGIAKCFRKNMTIELLKAKVPYPRSFVVDTTDNIIAICRQLGGSGVWIKRGDFHAIHKEDVSFAATPEQAQDILAEYKIRGIPDAVISEHLPGDLVKFYAVRDTDFFYWFYPFEHNHHKYLGYEQINGTTDYFAFDLLALKKTANLAAETLGVHIYGGDAIIGADGKLHLIDLNDWPSFAPCRSMAGTAISTFLFNYFNEFYGKRDTYTQDRKNG